MKVNFFPKSDSFPKSDFFPRSDFFFKNWFVFQKSFFFNIIFLSKQQTPKKNIVQRCWESSSIGSSSVHCENRIQVERMSFFGASGFPILSFSLSKFFFYTFILSPKWACILVLLGQHFLFQVQYLFERERQISKSERTFWNLDKKMDEANIKILWLITICFQTSKWVKGWLLNGRIFEGTYIHIFGYYLSCLCTWLHLFNLRNSYFLWMNCSLVVRKYITH